MEIIFLGTSSMVPTKTRNQSGLLIKFEDETILIDCGEGMQRQIKITGEKITKITKILITHLHGDHTLGLPGILQTINATNPEQTIEIYGPKGIKENIQKLTEIYQFTTNAKTHEINEGTIYENENYKIQTAKLEHSVPSYGYAIETKNKIKLKKDKIEKENIKGEILKKLSEGEDITWNGKTIKAKEYTETPNTSKKITTIMDTALCSNAIKLAENSDLLIAESTYANDLENKAEEYKHLTARQAAEIANKSGSKKLILTHFSQRYKETTQIESDARETFDNTTCAKDFMRIII